MDRSSGWPENMANFDSSEVLLQGVQDDFQIDGSYFRSHGNSSDWEYTGPLDDLVEWFQEQFRTAETLDPAPPYPDLAVTLRTLGAQLDDPWGRTWRVQTSSHSLEDVWRRHLGKILILPNQPRAGLAAPGETLSELKLIIAGYNGNAEDDQFPLGTRERTLFERWQSSVASGRVLLGFRPWVRSLSSEPVVPSDSENSSSDSPKPKEKPTFDLHAAIAEAIDNSRQEFWDLD